MHIPFPMIHTLLTSHWLPVTETPKSLEHISPAVVVTLTKPQFVSYPRPWQWVPFPNWVHSVLFWWVQWPHFRYCAKWKWFKGEYDTYPWRLPPPRLSSLHNPAMSVLHPGEHPGTLSRASFIPPNHGAEKSTVYQGQAGGLKETALAQLQLVFAMGKWRACFAKASGFLRSRYLAFYVKSLCWTLNEVVMKEDVELTNEQCDFGQVIFPVQVCYRENEVLLFVRSRPGPRFSVRLLETTDECCGMTRSVGMCPPRLRSPPLVWDRASTFLPFGPLVNISVGSRHFHHSTDIYWGLVLGQVLCQVPSLSLLYEYKEIRSLQLGDAGHAGPCWALE